MNAFDLDQSARQNSHKHLMGELLPLLRGEAHRTSLVRINLGLRDRRADKERRHFRLGRLMSKQHGVGQVVQMRAWVLRRDHVRGTLDVHKLGPNAKPVLGTEIPAAHLAFGGNLDGTGVLRRGLAVGVTVPPLADLDVALDANALAKLGDGQCPACGEVFVEGHASMVAGATDFASSNCSRSARYRAYMDHDAVQQHRRRRLEEAAEKAGGKAALGRLLGYQDGAFVGQMLRGERPIKEDTVLKLESKIGFKGWFGERMAPSGPQALSPLEEDLLAAFRSIPDDEQQELVQHTMSQAERYNKLVQQLLEKRGLPVTGFASATRTAETLPPAPKVKKPKAIKTSEIETRRTSSLMTNKASKRRVG